MRAVYLGLGALFGEKYDFQGDFHKTFWKNSQAREKAAGLRAGRLNSIDRVFEALEAENVTINRQDFEPDRSEDWRRADGSTTPSIEHWLVGKVATLPNGSYFSLYPK